MLQFLIWPFSSGKKLNQVDFGEKINKIKSKRRLDSEIAASKARKEERTVRRSLRKISRQVKEAASILSSLHQAAAQKKPDLIKGKNWKKWQGELKKLEILKIRTSEYAALISKVLAETISSSGKFRYANKDDRDQLKIYKEDILKNSELLESKITSITINIQKINNLTGIFFPPEGDKLWGDVIYAIGEASKLFTKIEVDGQAGLALEQKVREEIGRG